MKACGEKVITQPSCLYEEGTFFWRQAEKFLGKAFILIKSLKVLKAEKITAEVFSFFFSSSNQQFYISCFKQISLL